MAEGVNNRNRPIPRVRRGIRAGVGLIPDDDDWEDEGQDRRQFPGQGHFQGQGHLDRNRGQNRHDDRDEDRGHRFGQGRGRGGGAQGRGRGGGDQGRGRGGGAQGRGDRPLVVGVKLLENLKEREPSGIILTLANPQTAFRDSLVESIHKPDLITLLLYVLAKAFTCNSLPEQLNRLSVIIKEAKFYDTAMMYFMDMLNEDRVAKQRQFKQPIKDMITIMGQHMVKNPTSVTEFVGIHTVLKMVVDGLREKTNIIDEDLLHMFREFTDHKEKLLCKRARKTEDKDNKAADYDDVDPPDDFRDIQIFPQTDDMQADNDRYLRANKRKGKYIDLDHYLDVQFRLLREDFVAPLREGISDYIRAMQEQQGKKKKPQDVRIYSNVRLIAPQPGENGLCHVIQFDVSRMAKVRWQSSKRLIFGSLLCLTPDNFKSYYFATIVNRDLKKLSQGLVVVRFEHANQVVNELFGVQLVMAETTAYFESYRHVLTGLQSMREGELPFERYITQCESQVQPPAYLRRRVNTCYDLRPLVDDDAKVIDNRRLAAALGDEDDDDDDIPIRRVFSEHSAPAKDVKLLDRTAWPPADLLHLDDSQFEAIHTALTKEFVITQGPPGTGKTYIGLKIVKALLHNKDVWSKHPDTGAQDNRPMLIVCYTNHALDQFLEGIVSFYKGDIIRVGGRSQSEVLKPFNLHNFRARFRHERKIPVQVFQGRREAKNEMDSISSEIGQVSEKLQVTHSNIIHEDYLRPFMGEQYALLTGQFEWLLHMYPDAGFMLPPNYSVIVEWLGYGNMGLIVELEANMHGEQGAQGMPVADDQLIDVEDERDAIQAQRQLGDDEEDEVDDDLSDDEEFKELTRKEIIEKKIEIAAKEQQRAVALDVNKIGEKPKNVQDGEWQVQKKEKKKMKKKIQRNLTDTATMKEQDAQTIVNLWQLPQDAKWRLYRLWIQKYSNHLLDKIREKEEDFDKAAKRYREALMQEDKEIMRYSTVIGMTTTGAARYQTILQEIRPRIIVVEEAAEVLEAHIITTLSRGCEHLILIGDHKQLKPNPTVFRLATEYNLDVSLFERMVDNGIHCDCLELQHRMRPEIAQLMLHIYKDLRNHVDVLEYEDIKGISSNIFFVNHGFPERSDEDLRSHSNVHEASYIVGLCKYLLLQGYKPEQITVLTLYSGQLFCLRGMMPKEQFEGVRVTVVDNYQGEENDIILLSLVRSNEEGSIGFLKIENRICVALSRAKKGFYAIGNFEMLQQKSSLWNEIVIDMKSKNRLGNGLKLYCQNHPDDEPLLAKLDTDFDKAPEGGCQKRCGFRLECGHSCEMYCHVTNQDHKESICMKKCNKVICLKGHKCTRQCFENCGKCETPVEKTIPRCGHTQMVPCSVPATAFSCKHACETILPCGHECQADCGQAHTKVCVIDVEKTWPCGHVGVIKCHQKDVAVCPTPCDMVLSCDHRCQGTCGKCFQGRLHRACQRDCNRILVCGHECTDRCNQCPPCQRECRNKCQHSKCIKKCGALCAPCREPCTWQCQHHQCMSLCSEPCDRPRCNVPCPKILDGCGHPCIGLCGEPCPLDCRVCDKEKVTQILFGNEDEPDARFVRLEDCRANCTIEVTAMDTYMDMKIDDRGEIKTKECPKCKTPIRTTTRYRAIINSTLQDIEAVKETVLSNTERIKDLCEQIKDAVGDIGDKTVKVTLKKRLILMKDPKSENALAALLNQSAFAKVIDTLQDDWEDISDIAFKRERETGVRNLENFMDWVVDERSIMTKQEIADAEMELARAKAHLQLTSYQMSARAKRVKLEYGLKARLVEADKMLMGHGKYEGGMKITIEGCIDELKKLVPANSLGVTEEERIMIVEAMALPQGHWFKCPKGHVYAIGDCGGATGQSQCPECKETIGGANHQLRADNRFAGEMDGAAHPAWSEQANLGNYGFNAEF